MRYSMDENCPPPADQDRADREGTRIIVAIAITMVAMFISLFISLAHGAVVTSTHRTYALKTCSTCREIVYLTEPECVSAGDAEAQRVGATREIGSAVYTCIIRHNIIATFRPNASGRAVLSWQHDGLNVEGFRIVYGASPTALTHVVQLESATLRTYTLQGLAPGTYYFAMFAYSGGNDSDQSQVVSKVVP